MGRKAADTADTADPDERGRRKLDLSATQVAGSSLATVAAALLASKMGVYGTILGAGVVSVVATAGGPVIQHLFRRTGDQLRGSTRPRGRQVPPPPGEAPPPPGEFGEATVHGTRVRGWKRTAVASGAAFALALGGLGTYEALAGTSVSSDGRTLLSGGSRTAPDHRPAPPKPDGDGRGGKDRKGRPGGEEGRSGTEGPDGKTPGSGTSPSPSGSHGGRAPSPGPTPSGSGGPTDPAPSPTPSKQSPGPGPTPGSGGTGGAREPSPGAP
ncbi:hypothetical protein QEZ40_001963 [Streptomyces katrae]|uniref:Uncharacterized protein n=1 Tax=Streptomyces katrae TaxID=68223 RepID=A0ABT7GUJ8_9ACTN|nr:hypothetical protein [Streptomyces katrae]MDK9497306.1 hypothetical protein [Streptomyces katrae]